MGFYGNATGGFGMPKILEIVDDNGNTIIGTVTDSEVIFDATRDDVKVGKIFASADGVQEGIDTRTYRTIHGTQIVPAGGNFSIKLSDYELYNYTKFQAMIATFNTTQLNSTSVMKVSLNDAVYDVNSNVKISDVTKNSSTKSIDLNIVNNSGNSCVIHYAVYKEEE